VRLRRLRRRLLGLGRLLVAVALLAALWYFTVKEVGSANQKAKQQQLNDRQALAQGFANSAKPLVASLASDIGGLAAQVAADPSAAQRFVTDYAARNAGSSRQAAVVNQSEAVVASSTSRIPLGLRLPKCSYEADNGQKIDTELSDLLTGLFLHPAVTSGLFAHAPDCSAGAVFLAPAGRLYVIVETSFAPLFDAVSLIRQMNDNAAYVVDPRQTVLTAAGGVSLGRGRTAPAAPDSGPAGAPDYVTNLIRYVQAAKTPAQTRKRQAQTSPAGSGGTLAMASIGDGWSLVVAQNANSFNASGSAEPQILVGTLLTGSFAAVLVLLALFDMRRQRAHQRSEVAKHAFFSIVGHELRTPLTVLKGFTETLSDRWDALDENRRRLMIDNLSPQVLRLSRVVDRLLLASAIQSETNAHPVVRPVPLEEHLQRVVRQFRPVAPLHTFLVEVQPDVPDVLADPAALDQVLDQVVDNAVRYSPAGGTVQLRARMAGRGVAIVIDDEGVGLPSDYRRVFEAFVQGEAVDRRVHDEGGVGVGLFIARSLLKQMGGRVDAVARETGARFVVRLRTARTSDHVTSQSVTRP